MQTRGLSDGGSTLVPPLAHSDGLRDVFVARQPILDRSQSIFGYELLYRSCGVDGTARPTARSTTEVVLNSLLHIGLERLVAGKVAFLNFDRDTLLGDLTGLLPNNVAIEVLEDVPPDTEVLARCRQLKAQGFQIALDDVTDVERLGELITVADFLKVDFRLADAAQQQLLARVGMQHGIRLVAEKVETSDEFDWALSLGYGLAQGFFFERPKIIRGSNLPPQKLVFLRLLREISRPDPDFRAVEEILKHEPALVYKLLRYLNSAAFAFQHRIDSIHHALVLLGSEQIRKWIGLLALSGLTESAPAVLTPVAITRARFCELVCQAAGHRSRCSELFLLGLLSLFDAMLRRPMLEIIERVDLADDVRRALLGDDAGTQAPGAIYSLVLAYEAGSWDEVDAHAARLGIQRKALTDAYTAAVAWAAEVVL